MDDTQDKVRRNLVVFSATIVIGRFLNMKLTDIAKPLVSSNIDNVNTGRLWIVTIGVLIYLFLRYRFDTQTNSQIVFLSDELKAQRKNYVFKYLQRNINRINHTGNFSPIFSKSLSKEVGQNKEEYEKNNSQSLAFRLHIVNPRSAASAVECDESKTIWRGTISISEEYFKKGTSQYNVTNAGQKHDFSVPFGGRIWIHAHSLIHVVPYSKSAVDLIVPMILAALAFLISTNKLIAIYLS